MATTTRAVFIVTSVTQYAGFAGSTIIFSPVNPQLGSSDFKQFWEATPNGEIKMQITNPDAAQQFKPGKEFYVDFTEIVYASPNSLVSSKGEE